MKLIRYRIPEGICYRDFTRWEPDAEKAGIVFDGTPKPLYYRDPVTGGYVVMQEVEDAD